MARATGSTSHGAAKITPQAGCESDVAAPSVARTPRHRGRCEWGARRTARGARRTARNTQCGGVSGARALTGAVGILPAGQPRHLPCASRARYCGQTSRHLPPTASPRRILRTRHRAGAVMVRRHGAPRVVRIHYRAAGAAMGWLRSVRALQRSRAGSSEGGGPAVARREPPRARLRWPRRRQKHCHTAFVPLRERLRWPGTQAVASGP